MKPVDNDLETWVAVKTLCEEEYEKRSLYIWSGDDFSATYGHGRGRAFHGETPQSRLIATACMAQPSL